MTALKSSGDAMHPCRTPDVIRKKAVIFPFTRMQLEEPSYKRWNVLQSLSRKPASFKISQSNSLLIVKSGREITDAV